jgi:large subunit ribosomal protein L30
MAGKLRVTLRKSTVGTNPKARGTVRALGLRRIGQTVEITDDPAVRGQVRAVHYLVDVEEVAPPARKKKAATTARKKRTKKKEEAES